MLSGIVPVKLLIEKSAILKFNQVKLTLLRSPTNLLFLRLRYLRFVQLPRPDGSSPYMLLLSNRSSSNVLSWPIESGMLPLSPVDPRSRTVSLTSFTMWEPSRTPCKLLLGRDRCSNEVALNSSSGRAPLKLL
uniref:Uncharacterized protein n=1 Tax=Oryza brachyantha TaxID=4533 RepID=J3MH25_ORYBR